MEQFNQHILVIGNGGSGVSNMIHQKIWEAIENIKDVEIYLIDPKQVEYRNYVDKSFVKAHDQGGVSSTTILKEVESIINSRYNALRNSGIYKREDYNNKSKEEEKMNDIYVFIDRITEVINDIEGYEALVNILKYGRIVGVRVIAGTNTISYSAISSDIFYNFNEKIVMGLGVENKEFEHRLNISDTKKLRRNQYVIIDYEGVSIKDFNYLNEISIIGKLFKID